jgi:hypothetical protein
MTLIVNRFDRKSYELSDGWNAYVGVGIKIWMNDEFLDSSDNNSGS